MKKIYKTPERLIVGFNQRESATNGRLGFVTHYDPKTNTVMKERSFKNGLMKPFQHFILLIRQWLI